MPVTIVPINGNSLIIDYNKLQKSFENFLGDRCTEATMYVFNRFPIPVSTEVNIDLLLLISIHDKSGNFTRFSKLKGEGYEYFKNAIIPINVQSQFLEENIDIRNKLLYIEDNEYDAKEDLTSIRFGLLDFVEKKCGMDKIKLHVEPIQLILNSSSSGHFQNYLFDSEFNSEEFFSLIKSDPIKYFRSTGSWTKDIGYTVLKNDVIRINNAISAFTDYGYLTKRKIERIGTQLSKASAMYESIGQQPTSINGKAGTGKTSHLLHLLVRSLKNNNNITFLTYNHLLTKSIACEVKMIQNNLYRLWESEGQNPQHFANATVQTLMSFIYRLSKSLAVLHLMTKERVKELENVLSTSIDFLLENLPNLIRTNEREIFKDNKNNWDAAIECVQNSSWEVTIKQYGIAFIWYLKKSAPGLTQNLPKYAKEFYDFKLDQLREINYQNVFLRDYTGCLKNTLKAIRETKSFYEEFDMYSEFDYLNDLFSLSSRKQDSDSEKGKLSLETFEIRVKNVLKGRTTKGRILMIDESQDCHPYEREIFYEIFKPQNVIVSYGGQEQLIRFSELCHWDIFRYKRVNLKKIGSGNKSYRIKQSILDFCNFIAESYDIELELKSFSIEDTGHLIFDFRNYEIASAGNVFSDLIERGLVNGCSAMESLMIFDINKRDKKEEQNRANPKLLSNNKKVGVVNEYNVLIDESASSYKQFPYLGKLSEKAEFWNGATNNKQRLVFPAPNEVRVINYESCRGLEAWCVICFNIDTFYFTQTKKDEAERYLLHEGLVITKETRAAMYAITWVLMAATRAIDTLYLHLSNPSNELYQLCKLYSDTYPENCTIYKN